MKALLRKADFNMVMIMSYDVRNEGKITEPVKVNEKIRYNRDYIKKRFNVPLNNDVVVREILLMDSAEAFIVFYDGMSDIKSINEGIIRSLLEIPYIANKKTLGREIEKSFISHAQAMRSSDMDEICEEINFGSCALFVDGIDEAFVLDVRKWATRSIDKPENEQSIYGPQEAFAEMMRTNTALVRKIIKTERLIAEGVKIGNVSKTRGVLLYLDGVVNEGLLKEVRRRINSLDIDYINASEEVGLLLEESSLLASSQIMYTERPDRAARLICEGRVIFILNGSPHALIFPTTVFEVLNGVSDPYMRVPYANLSRAIRLAALFFAVLLPGIYLAITLYHHELIPTYLLYSISAARENVPFPSIIELLLMDISFEMIREAGLRMPSAIGSPLGIVGGLILGQSAVSAEIVSPIMIIVIAITGIGSFAVTDYSTSWTTRLLRVGYIILGATVGLYGIAMGIFLYAALLCAQKSFGVPFIAPMPKVNNRGMTSSVFENEIWKRELRPGFLRARRKRTESRISRKWDIKNKDINVSRETFGEEK